MSGAYEQLAKGANDYIDLQRARNGLISIVAFGTGATVLYERETRNNGPREGYNNGGTDFVAALKLALQIVGRNPAGHECRILFFTDGCPNSMPDAELQTIRRQKIRMDVIGYGNINQANLNQLATCGGQVTIGHTMNEVQEAFRAIAAAD
jgi:uncharacterized protein with von Willebrand factor type A (vWA) domain